MVRKVSAEDIPTCAGILCSVYNNEMWGNHWQQAVAEEYLTDYFIMEKFVGYVMEENAEVLGAVFAHEKVWWSGSEVYVEELFVKPEHQGKGIGKRLMEQMEAYVREKGLAGITLATNRYAPAREFYKKLGFRECEHVLFMAREL